jgi:hypothetical protein
MFAIISSLKFKNYLTIACPDVRQRLQFVSPFLSSDKLKFAGLHH